MTSELTELIANVYMKNARSHVAMLNGHSVRINLSDHPVDMSGISFDSENYPYLRTALLDKYIEDCNDVE